MDNDQALEIIEKFNKIIVVAPDVQKILNEIDTNIKKSKAFGTPLGCFILAEGGMGKTTICKIIISRYPSYTKQLPNCIKNIIPAFYIEVPSPVTVKTLAAHMLMQFNDPTPTIGDTLQLTNRLCECIKNSETQLVILDEFHHLIDLTKTSKRLNQNVASWIKNLVNRTGITFCLVGLPQFESIIKHDTQLARRFPLTFKVKKLQYLSNGTGTLQKFLNRYEKNIIENTPVTFLHSLNDKLLSLQIFAATNGNISFISLLIKEAVFIALNSNNNFVTTGDFAEAWETGIMNYVSLTRKNPFLLDINSLSIEIRSNL